MSDRPNEFVRGGLPPEPIEENRARSGGLRDREARWDRNRGRFACVSVAVASGQEPVAEERREEVFTAATLLLVGIAVVGIAMIGLTILWGTRMRRRLRRAPSKQQLLDELWYLRARSKPPSDKPADEDPPQTPSPE